MRGAPVGPVPGVLSAMKPGSQEPRQPASPGAPSTPPRTAQLVFSLALG